MWQAVTFSAVLLLAPLAARAEATLSVFLQQNPPSTAEVKNTFGGMLRKELVEARDSLAIEIGIQKFIEWITEIASMTTTAFPALMRL